MALISKEYQEYVLDDLKKNEGLLRTCKASFLERLFIRKAGIKKLHPNPDDEFCLPKIGPNFGIVQDYANKFEHYRKCGSPIVMEPLFVEKLKPRGYRIINGHHRWLAANRLKMVRVPIRIVNVTTDEEIQEVLNRSENAVCASMDLDEIIMVKDGARPMEPKPWCAFLFRERIREGVPALISELQKMGCDVWVYTGGYYSTAYIRALLRAYRVQPNGIINGLRVKKRAGQIRASFRSKYAVSVHCDTENVTCVRTGSKEYDIAELSGDEITWASETMKAIRGMDSVRNARG